MNRLKLTGLALSLACWTAGALGQDRPPPLISPYNPTLTQPATIVPSSPTFGEPVSQGLGEPIMSGGQQLWLRGEYLLWRIKNGNTPPLVTTSPQDSLGVLGQPGTSVIAQDFNYGTLSGGRFSAIYWANPCLTCGIGGSFFFLGQGATNFSASSPGDPLLARPFFNINTGQDSELVSNLPDQNNPFRLPLSGRVSVSSRSRLWGADANGYCNICANCQNRLDVFGGFNYLSLDEGFTVTENLLVPDKSPLFAGNGINLYDSFATRNNFYGGQIGARGTVQRGRAFVEVIGKVALGCTNQTAMINGGTTFTEPGGASQSFPGGLLAQQTNIGSYSRNQFSVVPMINTNLGWQLTTGLRAFAGYNFMYWTNVARPGDQVDFGINPSQLPPGQLSGPARPAFAFHNSDFWAQGLNFGMELRY